MKVTMPYCNDALCPWSLDSCGWNADLHCDPAAVGVGHYHDRLNNLVFHKRCYEAATKEITS